MGFAQKFHFSVQREARKSILGGGLRCWCLRYVAGNIYHSNTSDPALVKLADDDDAPEEEDDEADEKGNKGSDDEAEGKGKADDAMKTKEDDNDDEYVDNIEADQSALKMGGHKTTKSNKVATVDPRTWRVIGTWRVGSLGDRLAADPIGHPEVLLRWPGMC